jgi:hypothetical protein
LETPKYLLQDKTHSSLKSALPTRLFSLPCTVVCNLLKIGTIKALVFTLIRTLSPEVLCFEYFYKNTPGVCVPPPNKFNDFNPTTNAGSHWKLA